MSTPPPLPAYNPYAAPVARIDDPPAQDLVLADRGLRLVAALIDAAVWVATTIPVFAAIPVLDRAGAGSGPEGRFAFLLAAGLMLAGMVAVLAWNLVWLHRHGQTVGKRLVRVKVLRSDGSHCAVWRIVFARWLPVTLLGMIPVLGYGVSLVDCLMIFRADRRCLHDLIADTIVVRA